MAISREKTRKLRTCRGCGDKFFYKALTLGNSPLANSFLSKAQLGTKEDYFPLTLKLCKKCGLLQLEDIVNPDLMFRNYLYVSSTSKTFIEHFQNFARSIYDDFKLSDKDLIIDVGSNDGILLKPFKQLGVKTLGVDPAKNVAKIAKKNGIRTFVDYFNISSANKILKKYGKVRIITAANVFAHTDNWEEFAESSKILLEGNGIIIIEVPYLLDFIQKNLFDTIYHEHLSYLAIRPLDNFFKKHNFKIFKVQKTLSHGGSIRVFIERNNGPYKVQSSVKHFLNLERKAKLFNIQTFKTFAKKMDSNKKLLLNTLNKIKNEGKKIIGFGAPAKGNTLLNYFGIGTNVLDYIVDDNKLKQNLYTPGTHILIKSPKTLHNDSFDYVLILAWNFADSIINNHAYLRNKGVKFIVPIPTAKIIN